MTAGPGVNVTASDRLPLRGSMAAEVSHDLSPDDAASAWPGALSSHQPTTPKEPT